ncbi:unnamed protein product [Caenorhabditis angaria]|uniref:TLC domain-containing protein n=1 Tax=Caenorhabditis angaria TaxID=860376 RepID=A0A9P1N241_9PELO|nr:unnamed protein product [Caenorhabditis angaria]
MSEIKGEHKLPEPSKFLRPYILIPFIIYFVLFRLASRYVKNNLWLSFKGFKRYRLHNLSICWLHAVIVGGADFVWMSYYAGEIFENIIDHWTPITSQIPLISVAYFLHDAIDMLSYEWSKWTFELLLHHILTCLTLVTPAMSDKFLMAAGWVLIMEINSIFLHARTILQICGMSKDFPAVYQTIVYFNIITFVFCRIFSQIYWVYWAVGHINDFHIIYQIVGYGGPIVFGVINSLLFVRLLASDGFLSTSMKNKYGMTRDQKEEANSKQE